MRCLFRQFISVFVLIGILVSPAFAGDKDPLFVNLTTDDAHRVNMAIAFGKNQLERGHPLTLFLNDRGVLVGSTAQASTFGDQQKQLEDIMGKGATIIVCPFCMKHYGIQESELMPGLKPGNPDLTGGALFQDDTKTLTW